MGASPSRGTSTSCQPQASRTHPASETRPGPGCARSPGARSSPPTGATVAIGIVVAHDHPGASAPGSTDAPASTRRAPARPRRPRDERQLRRRARTSRLRQHGNTGNTGTSSSSHFLRPDVSSSTPTVTSGGTSSMTARPTCREPVLTTRSFRRHRHHGHRRGAGARPTPTPPSDMLAAELEAIDLACSRFRDDSELQGCTPTPAGPVAVSELLFEALSVAVDAAERTGGAVDPTVGNAIAALGYDADLDEVRPGLPRRPTRSVPSPATSTCSSIRADRTVRIPRGVRLDLGSTAKALAADRAAARIAGRIGGGRAGEPRRRRRRRRPATGRRLGRSASPGSRRRRPRRSTRWSPSRTGGLASSATSVRTWKAGDRHVHHIVDPADRGLRRALLGPGLGHRRQLRRGQPRDDRRHRVG